MEESVKVGWPSGQTTIWNLVANWFSLPGYQVIKQEHWPLGWFNAILRSCASKDKSRAAIIISVWWLLWKEINKRIFIISQLRLCSFLDPSKKQYLCWKLRASCPHINLSQCFKSLSPSSRCPSGVVSCFLSSGAALRLPSGDDAVMCFWCCPSASAVQVDCVRPLIACRCLCFRHRLLFCCWSANSARVFFSFVVCVCFYIVFTGRVCCV
jgi:hypothetical protein